MQEAGGRISFTIELPEDDSKKPEKDISKYEALPLGKLVTTYAADIDTQPALFCCAQSTVVAANALVAVFAASNIARQS